MNDVETPATTPFEALGGEAGVRRLADAFYDALEREPAARALRALHHSDLGPMRARLADWLIGWSGGPPVYGARHPDRPCIRSAHQPFRIGEAEAAQWMGCMRRAMDDAGVPQRWRAPLDEAFSRMCAALRNA